MTTTGSTFPYWTGSVDIPSEGSLEYKFVIQTSSGDLKWESGSNRHLQAQGNRFATVKAEFGQGGARVSYEADPGAQQQQQQQQHQQQSRAEPPRSAPARAPAASAGREVVPAGEQATARVHFRVKCATNPGETVSVCGSVPGIGGWNPGQALQLRSSKEEYPFWSGETEVALSQVKDCIRYKYVVKTSEAGPHRWEDAIADRTINPERRPGQVGLLTANTETFVDDGPFNQLQRTCTFVRDIAPRGSGRPALASSAAPQIPAGMQLVSMEQVRQWEARVQELEEECGALKERAKTAETAVDALSAELEEERRQNEEIQKQMQFVEALISRMKKMEEQVASLEQTKEVLITRSESLTDVTAKAAAASPAAPGAAGTAGPTAGAVVGAAATVPVSVAHTIEAGLQGAKQILTSLDGRIPR